MSTSAAERNANERVRLQLEVELLKLRIEDLRRSEPPEAWKLIPDATPDGAAGSRQF
jgi:hypothetical protein